MCAQINASNINVTDGICLWSNLAGQTPDQTQAYNEGVNNFLCGGDASGDCTFAAGVAVTDYTGSTPYYGLVQAFSNISAAADSARTYYEAFNVALSRYNCEEQYSHWNCDDCRKAYARWATAMTYPACEANPCEAKKPCVRVCNEVVQKCPVTLGFTCPDDNRDYSDSGCNLMGLVAGASNVPASMAAMVLSAGVALAFARQ